MFIAGIFKYDPLFATQSSFRFSVTLFLKCSLVFWLANVNDSLRQSNLARCTMIKVDVTGYLTSVSFHFFVNLF